MKLNPTFLLLVGLSLTLAAPAEAQRSDSLHAERMREARENRVERMERAQQMRIETAVERLDRRLELSDEQETEIRRLLEEHRAADTADPADQVGHQALGNAIAVVLTDQQRSVLVSGAVTAHLLRSPRIGGVRHAPRARAEAARRLDRRHRALHRIERQRRGSRMR